MVEIKKQLPLLSIIIGVMAFLTAIIYQLQPERLIFYLVLAFFPCVMLVNKNVPFLES